MYVASEGWPVWSDPTDELQLKLLKKLMLVLMERCQNTQCITDCCIWGCIAPDQSGCPCWPLSTAESANSGHVSIRTGQRSNGRRWPGLMNHVFFYITWMDGCVCFAYLGNTWHQDAIWEGSVMLWAMFCKETLGPAIHVNVTLTRTTYLSIIADHGHPFMETVFSGGCGLFQQDNVPCNKAKMVQEWFQEHNNEFSKFPRTQSNWASVGCAEQTSPIHGGPTSQFTGPKGSAAKILEPDTTAHLQGSSGVHA